MSPLRSARVTVPRIKPREWTHRPRSVTNKPKSATELDLFQTARFLEKFGDFTSSSDGGGMRTAHRQAPSGWLLHALTRVGKAPTGSSQSPTSAWPMDPASRNLAVPAVLGTALQYSGAVGFFAPSARPFSWRRRISILPTGCGVIRDFRLFHPPRPAFFLARGRVFHFPAGLRGARRFSAAPINECLPFGRFCDR